mmetsp:Transcript_95329/g.269330  ORF Transcript_95329/g.269330 Transcript_95329/m.269330 type:complete len:167 (+) Transcript_95329:297-797(+)
MNCSGAAPGGSAPPAAPEVPWKSWAALLLRVVGDGVTVAPEAARTGSGAKTSLEVSRFKGIPKLTALRRISVVGDMAICMLEGDFPLACVFIRSLGVHTPVGFAPGLPPPEGCTAGVAGDHGGLGASVDAAHGDMAALGLEASAVPSCRSSDPAPAIWMTARLAFI